LKGIQIILIVKTKSLIFGKLAIQQGLPTYAECGGLMYLSRKITYQGKSHKMVGVIQADTIMTPKPIGRGYVQLTPNNEHPWNKVAPTIYAHEFLFDFP
jgi:cobyrinic acid a,c-diamide synthase